MIPTVEDKCAYSSLYIMVSVIKHIFFLFFRGGLNVRPNTTTGIRLGFTLYHTNLCHTKLFLLTLIARRPQI